MFYAVNISMLRCLNSSSPYHSPIRPFLLKSPITLATIDQDNSLEAAEQKLREFELFAPMYFYDTNKETTYKHSTPAVT